MDAVCRLPAPPATHVDVDITPQQAHHWSVSSPVPCRLLFPLPHSSLTLSQQGLLRTPPGVEALRIGPIAVLPGPPQALRMSRGRVAGLKGGPRELKRPQPHVLEPGQQGVACLTGESLSQAAVQPFEVSADCLCDASC